MEAPMTHAHFNARHQRGAALVVGLMLLVVITLLAIGGMNTASVDLVMAGNTQYQQRAFEAAEVGIETILNDGQYTPGGEANNEEEENVAIPDPRLPGDKFTYVLSSDLCGKPQDAIWGSSKTDFSTYHFRIQSTGRSARNAQTEHNQGVAKISPKDTSFTPPVEACGTGIPPALTP
jgi:type IV pilus assembly protein PilX